ncbi:MAG: VOC family protein [Promethearchaeota archaeon]
MKEIPIVYAEDDASVYIALEVSDIDRAKKFYSDIFGFTVSFDTGDDIG